MKSMNKNLSESISSECKYLSIYSLQNIYVIY